MREQSKKHSLPLLNHFASVPALPKIKRHQQYHEAPPLPSTGSSRSGSQPQTHNRTVSKDLIRLGSEESVKTLSGASLHKGKNSSSPSYEPSPSNTRHPSTTDVRGSRLGSVASNASGPIVDKKKGLFSGFMRRKTGASVTSSACTLMLEVEIH